MLGEQVGRRAKEQVCKWGDQVSNWVGEQVVRLANDQVSKWVGKQIVR